MPWDPSKTTLSAPVIRSVACGAEGSLLKKRLTKDTVDAFPTQESFKNVKSFVEACALSVEGQPMPGPAVPVEGGTEKISSSATVCSSSSQASTTTAGAAAADCAAMPRTLPNSTATASAKTAAASAKYLRDTPLKPFLEAVLTFLFPALHSYVDEIPLQDMKAQRFGNKAFRDFCQKMADHLLEDVVKPHLIPSIEHLAKENAEKKKAASNSSQQQQTKVAEVGAAVVPSTVANELYEYLLDSFGNAQRIDYGTGHELHFWCFCFTAVVHIGAPKTAEEAGGNAEAGEAFKRGLADLVLVVFPQYLAFCRRIQHHYSLEPAGSHGVWGLDDYHHLPLLFGASQLVGHEPAILPKHITEREKVSANRPLYLYFEMIGWIMDNKKGPFHEHSPILYNVSGLDEWSRIRNGMLKMYVAEVMSRFAVVQHFLFGPTIPFKE